MGYFCFAAAAKSLQSCPTLCDPIDGSPPSSSVPGILQARILEWVAISFSNACMHAKLLQSCPTLCNPMDSSPTRLLCSQDSLGKDTGVGCHFCLHFCFVLFYLFIKFTMFLLWLSRGMISTNLSLEHYCMLCEVFKLPIVLKQAKT